MAPFAVPFGELFALVALEHLPMGDGFPPAFSHRHAVTRPRVAVERLVDGAARPVGRPPGERQIGALERSSLLP